jgi:hypothetical protein
VISVDGGAPKRRCTLSLERWCTLLEGANPKERCTFLKKGVALSIPLLLTYGTLTFSCLSGGTHLPTHGSSGIGICTPSLGNLPLLCIQAGRPPHLQVNEGLDSLVDCICIVILFGIKKKTLEVTSVVCNYCVDV